MTPALVNERGENHALSSGPLKITILFFLARLIGWTARWFDDACRSWSQNAFFNAIDMNCGGREVLS